MGSNRSFGLDLASWRKYKAIVSRHPPGIGFFRLQAEGCDDQHQNAGPGSAHSQRPFSPVIVMFLGTQSPAEWLNRNRLM
jgi:hypothetical protein